MPNIHNIYEIYAIPGWGFQAEIFLVSGIMAEFNIIALNYVNYMNNIEHVNLQYEIEHSTQVIESLAIRLSKQIPNDSIVLGWSLGGLIAIKLAYLFPNKVSKLILVSSQAKFLCRPSEYNGINSNQASSFIASLKSNYEKQIEQFISLVNYPCSNSQLKELLIDNFIKNKNNNNSNENLILLLTTLMTADFCLEYQKLSAHILHIINTDDAVIKQNAHYLKLLKPSAVIAEISKAGHAGFLSHDKIYQNIIKDFISS